MGRTPLPIELGVPPEWATRPEVQALADKGHVITPTIVTVDLLIHPRAHAWFEDMFENSTFLEAALRRVRELKRRAR